MDKGLELMRWIWVGCLHFLLKEHTVQHTVSDTVMFASYPITRETQIADRIDYFHYREVSNFSYTNADVCSDI